MKLTKGGAYEVLDWYGMVTWQGTYKGMVQDSSTGRRLHLVERDPGEWHGYKYGGCVVECSVARDGLVCPYLKATHYGNTVGELEPATGNRVEFWELMA